MGKNIITSTAIMQQYVRINVSTLKESWQPYEPDAQQKYLNRYLGDELLAEIRALAENPEAFPTWANDDDKKEIALKLLDITRNTLAKFTLYLLSPHIDLHLSEMGFVVSHTNQVTPASAERVKNAREAYLEMGFDCMETLLRFLEKNHSVITTYANSEAFVFSLNNYINSAETFDRFVPINNSRLKFIELKPEMDNVEALVVDPLISYDLANELRSQIRNNNGTDPAKKLTPENKKILPLIQRIIANQVAANMATDQKLKDRYNGYAANYIALLKQFLDKNANDYPAYKNSPQFVDTHTYTHKEYNDDDSRFYVFGHP